MKNASPLCRIAQPAARTASPTSYLSCSAAIILAAVLALSWLVALAGRPLISQVAGLHFLSAASPYFRPDYAGLLYLLTPLVVIASIVMFLTPGGLLTLTFSRPRQVGEWLVYAFGASLGLVILLTPIAGLLPGPADTGLLWLWAGVSTAAAARLAWQVRRGDRLSWPLASPADRRRLLAIGAAAWLATALLIPKLFWENFNLDGIEAFEFGRSLSTHLLPYWELKDNVFGFYPNFFLFAYPNHWFTVLFGPIEAAARLPFILYLVLLFPALALLIELGSPRRLAIAEEALLWFGLALFAVVQAFNTNYEPFYTDLAETAATDTLWMLVFLAAAYALWTERFGWFWLFGLFTYTASPGALVLLGGLAAGLFLATGFARLRQIGHAVGVAVAGVAMGQVYGLLLAVDGVNQFSAINMLRRLFPPHLTGFVRLNALIFPTGILPALFLPLVRRRDALAWTLAVTVAFSFGLTYIQTWTSLHQFTPAMVLPVVIFWRLVLNRFSAWQSQLLPLLATGIAVSLWLSLPPHFQINQTARQFGQATAFRVGNYDTAYEQAVRASRLLYALTPEDYRLAYPNQPWGTDALAWLYYATRPKPAGAVINYVVQPASDPPPDGAEQIARQDGAAVYVYNRDVWQAHRQPDIPRVVQSALYEPILHQTYAFFYNFWCKTANRGNPLWLPGKSSG